MPAGHSPWQDAGSMRMSEPHSRIDAATIARYRSEGFLSPLRVLAERHGRGPLALLDEIERAACRTPGAAAQHQGASARPLRLGARASSGDRRASPGIFSVRTSCAGAAGFFDKRPGDQQVRFLASGLHLLGPVRARGRHGLGRASRPPFRERLHAGQPAHAPPPPRPCRHRRPRQHAARPREIVVADVDEAAASISCCAPGEMSLHHMLLIHGSRPNSSGPKALRLRHPLYPWPLTPSPGSAAARHCFAAGTMATSIWNSGRRLPFIPLRCALPS